MSGPQVGGVAVAVVLLTAASAHAHALASTIVSVTMTRAGTVHVTIAAEADPLIAKLEALAGVAASEPAFTSRERRTRLASLFPTLRAHIDARAGGERLRLELQSIEVDDTAQTELHLVATAPDGRHDFTWRCTFVFGAYRLASGNAADGVEWLQGPQTSTPFTLAPRAEGDSSARALIRIGHSLAMGALVVYVIVRRRSERCHGAGPDISGWPAGNSGRSSRPPC